MAVLLLALCGIAFPFHASAQTNAVPANRWLFIVDTSHGMQRRAESARQIAASLIASGMSGQLHAGDSVGLWTFNTDLHSGQFPLQEWTPGNSRTVAQRVFDFLGNQKNEKDSRLEKIIPNLNQVIAASQFITVILISDGSSEIHGTPFDDRINASYKAWREQQEKSQMPFVTLLRARDGKIAQYVVNTPPFPLEFPTLPEELLKPRVTNPVAEVKKTEPAKPPVIPPLILSGKKKESLAETPARVSPETTEAPQSEPEPAKPPTVVGQNPPPSIASKPENAKPQIETPATNPLPESASSQTNAAIESQIEKTEAPAIEPRAPDQISTSVTPVETKRTGFWIATGIIVGALLIGTFLLLRGSRKNSQASLITRSLDRDQR